MKRALALVVLAACTTPRTPDTVVVTPARTRASLPSPESTSGPPPSFQLVPGGSGACFLHHETVRCADRDLHDWTDLTAFARVPDLEAPVRISGRSSTFGCALTRAGTVHCWGGNFAGELGAGLRDDVRESPVQVLGITGAVALSSNDHHACVVLADGGVACWGQNDHGQTGDDVVYDGRVRELVKPIRVKGVEGAVQIATTVTASCALTRAKKTFCWGEPLHEPRGTRGNEVAAHVPGADDLDALAGGDAAMCGIRAGEVVCWGRPPSSDPEADRNADKERGPRVVKLPGRAKKVSIGGGFACALLGDGRVACWGSEFAGQLGSQVDPDHFTYDMRVVPGVSSAMDVFVGAQWACALTRSEGLFCWGDWQPSDWGDAVAMAKPRRVRIE